MVPLSNTIKVYFAIKNEAKRQVIDSLRTHTFVYCLALLNVAGSADYMSKGSSKSI